MKATRKAGLIIFSALVLLIAAQSRLITFMLQEALTVVLGIAILHFLILLPMIAFLLLWHGTIFVLLALKRMIARITGVQDRPHHFEQPPIYPFPRH